MMPGGVYYIGIIDILQRWTWRKRLEWLVLSLSISISISLLTSVSVSLPLCLCLCLLTSHRFFKVYILRHSESGISCMAPIPYKNRFQSKVLASSSSVSLSLSLSLCLPSRLILGQISQIFEHSIFIREITGSWIGKRFDRLSLPPLSLLESFAVSREVTTPAPLIDT
jgi:hypothetical protein